MTKRQYDILKLLYQNREFTTYAEIAERLGVSVKTVRNDVSAAKEFLSDKCEGIIETKPHSGIRLVISDDDWKKLAPETDEKETEMFFFIVRHLFKTGELTAQRLSHQYYIGRAQLDRVLDRAAQWFLEKKILFERRRGKGISISYNEFNYRIARLFLFDEFSGFYANLVNAPRTTNYFTSPQDYAALCAGLDGFDPLGVAEAILKTEEEFGLSFDYRSGVHFLFLVSLSVLRIRDGLEVSMAEAAGNVPAGESGMKFALSLAEKLSGEYGIVFPKDEIKFIAFAADISEIQSFKDDISRRSFEGLNPELCRFTVKSVNLISEIAEVDLRGDKFFVTHMFTQLKASISRLSFGINFKNPLLSDIKTKYPNMMAIAWFLGNSFENELGLEINEHEVGFLALHIGGAIERRLSQVSACIVCDYGIGVSQILREKISRVIPQIRITSVFSGRDLFSIKKAECDFIISTTTLDETRLRRDVINVGHLLDDADIKKLTDYAAGISRSKKSGVKEINPNISLFNKELIFPKQRVSQKSEILEIMCSKLYNLGYVTADFKNSVLEREKSTPTDIGKGFAIPHGLGEFVNHSAAVFASLENPIEWTEHGEPVDLVFLIAFDLNEDEEVKKKTVAFYRSLVSFMENAKDCEKLRGLSNEKDIIKIFELW